MRIGYQPDVINLNKAETHDDHISWKLKQDEIRKQRKLAEKKQKDLEYAQNK